jgi:curved DNA-binding protein CbpA
MCGPAESDNLVGTEMNSPHKILGVSKTATLNEIKLAYRKLALQLHPDTNGGDLKKSEQFKQVASAYEILSNPETKKKWEFEQRYGNGWGDMQQQHSTSHPFRGRGGGSGIHFDEDEWNAFHYGINMDDFDFSGPDEFIIDLATGQVKRSSRKQKGGKKTGSTSTSGGTSSSSSRHNAFHEFSPDEVEEILKHATRQPKNHKSSSSSSSSRQSRHQQQQRQQQQQPQKKNSRRNKKDDCTIS